jgi:hypothetical protein
MPEEILANWRITRTGHNALDALKDELSFSFASGKIIPPSQHKELDRIFSYLEELVSDK